MKPLHIVLLVAGAALAGGLAVTMTQAPSISAPPPPVVTAPPVEPPVHRVAVPLANVPETVNPAPAKPSPIPVPRQRVAPPTRASAPEPVYDEPATPPIRKFKPILTANGKPTQWTPEPYQTTSRQTKAPAPTTSAAPAAPPQKHATAPAAPAAPANPPRQVTLKAGMTIPIRLDESLTSDQTVKGAMFEASLVEPFVVDGLAIAEKGARVTGKIVSSDQFRVELGLTTLATSDGQQVAISTDPWTRPTAFGDSLAEGTVIRFRLASTVTVKERQATDR
ncbi:MAG TPA: hypothetical protein VHY84_28500 [Bryobacteraceae bacterium]|jgi:hypothetical protein|nr:hypothetical protein [Bryobacteraceae bacterium]